MDLRTEKDNNNRVMVKSTVLGRLISSQGFSSGHSEGVPPGGYYLKTSSKHF